jgi:hypothetical protein
MTVIKKWKVILHEYTGQSGLMEAQINFFFFRPTGGLST